MIRIATKSIAIWLGRVAGIVSPEHGYFEFLRNIMYVCLFVILTLLPQGIYITYAHDAAE